MLSKRALRKNMPFILDGHTEAIHDLTTGLTEQKKQMVDMELEFLDKQIQELFKLAGVKSWIK
jgi:ABC-type transporter Mla MlaB component